MNRTVALSALAYLCTHSSYTHTHEQLPTTAPLHHELRTMGLPADQEHFMRSVEFTKHGMTCFIKHTLNHEGYAEFLANNWNHMTQFLQRKTDQVRNYYQSVFRMFGNKIKQSMYVNAYALSALLDDMLPFVKDACCTIKTPAYTELKKDMSELMYQQMLNNFDHLKADPDGYFADLSQQLVSRMLTVNEHAADASVQELRTSLLGFLETTLGKLVWEPQGYKQAWTNTKMIADQLWRYHEAQIFDDLDDVNALFITALERFCLYLDLSFVEIPIDFYQDIRADIANKHIPFMRVKNEQFFQTKAERLEQAVTMAEAKTRAYHQGILVG